MKRLSHNEIAEELLENDEMTMSTAGHFVSRKEQTVDRLPYDHRQEDPESQRAHTWINFTPAAALTNEQLAALRTEAQRLGRPLSDAEAKIILGPLPGSTATRVLCGPDDNGPFAELP
jgi:hypothetical protein